MNVLDGQKRLGTNDFVSFRVVEDRDNQSQVLRVNDNGQLEVPYIGLVPAAGRTSKELAFSIKADKPGRKDRFRADHDIGRGHVGNKPAMCAMIASPTEGDCGYYFLDRGLLKSDELLRRNPGAAIKITMSNHARGPAA